MGSTVAKQRKATNRVYPCDLHAILQGLWDNTPFFPNWPRVELPPKAVLDELLDVCFHASMLTEEGRPTFSQDGALLAWGNRDGTVTVCHLEDVQRRLAAIGFGW